MGCRVTTVPLPIADKNVYEGRSITVLIALEIVGSHLGLQVWVRGF